jgi:hypothetical protein
MLMSPSPHFLRTVLLIDAATCLGAGALMALGATLLAHLTAIPPGLLLYAGLSLFPIAAFMALTATQSPVPPLLVWIIIAGNAFWVAGSVWLMISGWITPNALGYGFITVQALAVAVLAKLEYDGLQRLTEVTV